MLEVWFPASPVSHYYGRCSKAGRPGMDRVLLQVKKKKDRRRLEDWLAKSCRIVLPHPEAAFDEPVDLVIIDGPSLKELRPKVRALRKAEEPVFLPFLLLTVR